jgi:hypothetical protein
MSSKDIALHIPMFVGQDFWFWKEHMTDYLCAQRLLGYALGQRQRPVAANVAQPTQAELVAMADWDKIDLQVKSMISMRLSSNLSTHIGTTSAATWNVTRAMLQHSSLHWDIQRLTQLYCNNMQMANITFDGVWNAIMAEFERIGRPAQLAHQADKISAVK